jgi:hypothetical protein
MWQDILRKQGVKAMINPEDSVSFLGVSGFPCRIVVPSRHLKKAQQVLASLKLEERK